MGSVSGPSWTRREVLGALAATAGLPAVSRGSGPRRRVGIVGGGMAGVALAWLLDGEREVVLLEARDAIGGNVQSVELELDGQAVVVDVGAQFFHPGPYPTYVQLLSLLGLFPPGPPGESESHAFPASITLAAGSEPLPRFVSPVIPSRVWPLFASWNWAGLQAFAVAFAAAKQREQANASWGLTLGDWLPTLGLSQAQWEGMLLPWAASLYSGDIEQARGLSARSAMIFAAKALPDNPTDPFLYHVLDRGMVEPLRRMLDDAPGAQVLTGAVVKHVSRTLRGGFHIRCVDGRDLRVDDLVFASSGPATLRLLRGLWGTAAQRAALRGIEFHDARLMVHADPAYAPSNPALWSFFNAAAQGGFCEASMWLAPVLALPPATNGPSLWKSWVTHREHLPSHVLHEVRFRHMLPTPASLAAQNALRALQGQGGVWFAGGYTLPFDSQETALLSALQVTVGLGAFSARARALHPSAAS
jgi:predicted NAD/FAD-binding protein